METKSFGCCGTWVHCSIVGYCVSTFGMEYGMENCELARNMFVKQLQHFRDTFKASAVKIVTEGREDNDYYAKLFECTQSAGDCIIYSAHGKRIYDPTEKERCEDIGKRLRESSKHVRKNTPNFSARVDTSNSSKAVRVSSTIRTSLRGVTVSIVNGGIVMNNVKVVKEGEHYDLISWVYKDLTHYAIREKGTSQIQEQWEPTGSLKGWDLRKHVIAELDRYDQEGPSKEVQEEYKSVVPSVKDVEVGQVFVWWNPTKEEYSFAEVTAIMPETIHCVKHDGFSFGWIKDSLQQKMDQGIVKVINRDSVPEGLTFVATR